jgi:hypothetical protein
MMFVFIRPNNTRNEATTSVAEPEPHHFGGAGAVTPTPPAPNLLANIGGLSKMSQTVTVSYFSH